MTSTLIDSKIFIVKRSIQEHNNFASQLNKFTEIFYLWSSIILVIVGTNE